MHSRHPGFTPPSAATEKRVDEILSTLTLEEKITLLAGHPTEGGTIPLPEKGIPQLRMADGPMGAHWWTEQSVSYPALIGLAATWNPELGTAMGKALGRDCLARGIHILLAPGVNIYRSALCGRNFEYLGEDPFLASRMVVNWIKALQDQGVSATVKHYALNFQEYDRHNISSDVDDRTLHEVYLPAFKAAIVEAGSGCLMTSYNLVNGVHASESELLLKKILKELWKFDGLVMSDWVSTYSTADAANNGLDLEMPRAKWFEKTLVLAAIKEGKLSTAVIDDKIRRFLRLAVCFGWLDREQKIASIPQDDPESRAASLNVSRESLVLLKNENNFLPLDAKKIKRLAVIGPCSHPAVIGGGGSAYNKPTRTISVFEGLKEVCGPSVEIVHEPGYRIARDTHTFRESVFTGSDGKPGVFVEFFKGDEPRGEPVSTRTDPRVDAFFGDQPPVKEIVRETPYSVRWTGSITAEETGTHNLNVQAYECGCRLWLDDELLLDGWENSTTVRKTVNVEMTAGKPRKFRFEMHKTKYWIHVHLGWEPAAARTREIAKAIELCRSADAVVLCAGFDQFTEGEGADRSFGLEKGLEDFILEAGRANPRTALILIAGGNVDMNRWIESVPALIHAWYPGQEGGIAVAEAVFGRLNPSGRLPATFEKRLEDRSSFGCYHDEDGDKRVALKDGIITGYRHHDKTGIAPRFPFGFGLSYTTFSYDNIRLSAQEIAKGKSIDISFDVTNTGSREGAEVCQLYLRDEESSLPRPVKELKGFSKVFLKPGEKKTATITLKDQEMRFYDPRPAEWVLESGVFEALIGSSASDIRLKAKFRIA
jgi:beta-glucosidase